MAESNIRIVRLVGSGSGYRITLSDNKEPFAIEAILVAKHRLKEGIVITVPQAADLRREASEGECDRETARLLALRPHSIGELRAKLKRKAFSEESVSAIIKKYRTRGLLDDTQVALSLARQSLERKPAGKSYLVALLRRKLIDRDTAEQAVNMILGDRDENEIAYDALARRARVLFSSKQLEVETIRRRAYTYLSRRGIGYAAAKAAFEKLLQEHETND
jgi:SOS response regulatory protein OraA/RecX